MNKKLILAVVCIAITASAGYAQKINVASGDVKPVLSEKEINIQYDYTNMKVGKTASEEEYVNQKVDEKNKAEAGTGDKWKENWFGSRQKLYQPKFEELINKELENKGIKHGNFPNAKYTLIVRTTFTEPGYNVGVMKQPSYVNYEFSYVETANPTNVVSKMTLDKVSGMQAMGFDYDTGTRVSESYAKGGKILGKYLNDEK